MDKLVEIGDTFYISYFSCQRLNTSTWTRARKKPWSSTVTALKLKLRYSVRYQDLLRWRGFSF